MYPQLYFDPLQEWLKNFTLDVDGEKFAPYDPEASIRIADQARASLGDQVPTDPAEIKKALGAGWWQYAPEMAEKLLLQQGLTRDSNGKWLLPDGTPWKIASSLKGRPGQS
jgi:peptide/nickel transport system substrate-binding protein